MRTFLSILLCACAVAGCSTEPQETAPEAGDAPTVVLTGNPTPALPAGKALAPGEWQVRETGDGVSASFAGNDGTAQLVVRCNRATRQVFVDRPNIVATGQVNAIVAGGERFDLPTAAQPDGGPGVSSPIDPLQPILAAMAIPGTSFTLLGPGPTEMQLPAAPGITRVIDTCLTA